MKSTLFLFAVLLGVALADDAKSFPLEEKAEGRLFGAGLLAIVSSLISLGLSIVVLLALIHFITALKGAVDLDGLLGKGEDVYYDTGYAPATGYGVPDTGHGGG
ncbi:unnamed protein product, partial [Meganyctiphanes norvegica]